MLLCLRLMCIELNLKVMVGVVRAIGAAMEVNGNGSRQRWCWPGNKGWTDADAGHFSRL